MVYVLDGGVDCLSDKREGREVLVRRSMAEGDHRGGDVERRGDVRDGAGIRAWGGRGGVGVGESARYQIDRVKDLPVWRGSTRPLTNLTTAIAQVNLIDCDSACFGEWD